eukprot:TRINITY_DN1416_c0_g1_i9.p1 TRINITY_DN1416_c0_g1~~TRINITY_DN1416_c0_g1_i9.p1  ORF type:complete len:3012 (-),score=602.09 TRINITY_DN1416_c0_g1_i9:53-8956(-)
MPSTYVMKLTVTAMNTESTFDYLNIFNSASFTSALTSAPGLSGSTLPTSPYISSSNVMSVQFTSDASVVYSGFTLDFVGALRPTISSISPTSGGFGISLTVNGANFGSSAGLVTVFLGTVACPLTTFSAAQLVCTLPSGSGAQTVSVRVDFATSSSAVTFTYLVSPTLSSISPTVGQTGTIITLTGTSFGTVATDISITVGGLSCPLVSGSLTDTSARCTAPAFTVTTATTYSVVITRVSLPSGSQNFQYVPNPALSGVSPSGGLAGSIITITGTNFGAQVAGVVVTVRGVTCPVLSASYSSTSLQCTTATSLTVGAAAIALSYYSVPSTGSVSWTVITQPVLSSISPNGGLSGTTRLTLSGSSFSSTISANTVTVGGVNCPVVAGSLVGTTSLQCNVPAGSGAQPVVLSVYATPTTSITFTYITAPILSGVLPSGGALSGRITISGSGFGTTAADVAVTVGGVVCVLNTISATSIQVTLPTGVSAGQLPITLTRFQVPATGSISYNYVTPSLTSINPIGGKAGVVLTLLGSFGTIVAQSNVAVTMGGVSCPVTSATSTSVTCTVPSIANADYAVILSHYGVATASIVFTYAPDPTISSIVPTGGVAGSPLTINGANFGSSLIDARVFLGGVQCGWRFISATQLAVSVPSIALGSYFPNVTRFGVLFSVSTVPFLVIAAPVVTGSYPTLGQGGQTLTLTGTLGATGCLAADFSVSLMFPGATTLACSSVSVPDCSTLSCTIPAATLGIPYLIQVTRFSTAVNTTRTLTFIASPVVTSLTPTVAEGNTTITIAGSGFGSVAGDLTVLLGSLPCPISGIPTDASISCTLPTVTQQVVSTVTVSRQLSSTTSTQTITIMGPPILTSVSPGGSPSGLTLTLTGTSFGNQPSAFSIFIGATLCPLVSGSLNNAGTQVNCVVPSLSLGVYNVTVRRNRFVSSARTFKIITAPSIAALNTISPVGGQASQILTITSGSNGSSFGGTGSGVVEADISVAIGGQPCPIVPGSYLSGSTIQCTVPSGVIGFRDVIVSVFSTPPNSPPYPQFEYRVEPAVALLTPAGGQSGTILTVSGGGFGTTESQISVTIGVAPCPLVAGTLDSDGNSLSCVVPALAPGFYNVTVTVLAIASPVRGASNLFESVLTPTSSLISPAGGKALQTVTITGTNFGANMQVLIAGLPCSNPIAASSTQLTCTAPPGQVGSPSQVVVSRYGIVSATTLSYTYIDSPIVLQSTPAGGRGGVILTLSGQGFGSAASDLAVFIRVNSTQLNCTGLTLVSGLVTCTLPTVSPNTVAEIVLRRYLVDSSTPNRVFTYYPVPVISQVQPPAGRSGSLITVSGLNFGSDESALAVKINAVACPILTGSLNALGTQLVCTVPDSALLGTFSLNVQRLSVVDSSAATFTYIPLPELLSLSPAGGVPQTNLQIRATSGTLGSDPAALSITIGSSPCPVVAGSLTSASVNCTVGVGVLARARVTLLRYNTESILQPLFFELIGAPVVVAISPVGGSGSSLFATPTKITILGSNFGADLSVLTIRVGSQLCTPDISSLNSVGTQVACTVPDLPAGSYTVSVTRYQVTSAAGPQFSVVNAPTVASVSPRGGRQDAVITIQGAGFGTSPDSVQVRVGLQICSVASIFNTNITCVVPAGFVGVANVTVSRYGIANPASYAEFTYVDVHLVSRIVPVGGIAPLNLTVEGVAFGESPDGLAITVGGLNCPVFPASLTTSPLLSSVVCQLPILPDGTQEVIVQRYGIPSLLPNQIFLAVSAPTLSSITPRGGQSDTVVTATGAGFGSTEAQVLATLGGVQLAIDTGSLSAAGNSFSVVVPDAAPGTVPFVVQRFNAGSAPLPFTYVDTPQLYSISPVGGLPSTVLTLTGTGFGSDPTAVSVVVGGLNCPINVASLSDTSVECTVPVGGLGQQTVVLWRYNIPSASPTQLQFNYVNTPILLSVFPDGGSSGDIVSLSGANFGNVLSALSVTVGGTDCPVVLNSLNSVGTTLQCVLPPKSAGNYTVLLSLYAVPSQSALPVQLRYVPTPVITDVTPATGEPNQEITITGQFLGILVTNIRITIASIDCRTQGQQSLSGTWGGTQTLTCITPSVALGVQPLRVLHYSAASTPATFEYVVLPVVLSVQLPGGVPGTVITVRGNYFGTNIQAVSAIIDGQSCVITSNLTFRSTDFVNAEFSCQTPASFSSGPGFYQVYVSIGDRVSASTASHADDFELVAPPSLSSVSPQAGVSGTILSLAGSRFGNVDTYLSIQVGELPCSILANTLNAAGTSLLCRLGEAPGAPVFGSKAVSLTRFGSLQSPDAVAFEYFPLPIVTTSAPPGGPVNTTITVFGQFFGTDESRFAVTLASISFSVPCPLVPGSLTPTSAQCLAPVLQTGQYNVGVWRYASQFASAISSNATFQAVPIPQLLGISPPGGSAPLRVTLEGRDFGVDDSSISVTVAGSPCVIVAGTLNSIGTRVSCNLPPLPVSTGVAEVQLYNLGLLATGTVTFTFVSSPVVLDVEPRGGQPRDLITVSGINFGDDAGALVVTVGGAGCPLEGGITTGTLNGQPVDVVVCRISESDAIGSQTVLVSRFNLASNSSFLFAEEPRVGKVTPLGGLAGTTLTIFGSRFGTETGSVSVSLDIAPAAAKAGPTSVNCAVQSISDTELHCTLGDIPASAAGSAAVIVKRYSLLSQPPYETFQLTRADSLSFVQADTPLGSAMIAIVAILALILFGIWIALVSHRQRPIVAAASLRFISLLILALVFILVSILALIGQPSDSACLAQVWISALSTICLTDLLLVKAFRYWRSSDMQKRKRVEFSFTSIVAVFVGVLSLQLLILVVWSSAWPPTTYIDFSHNPPTFQCQVNTGALGVSFAYQVLVMLAASFFSWNKPSESHYNERRHIALAVYNLLLVTVVVQPIVFNLATPQSVFILASVGNLFIVIGTISVYLFPILAWIRTNRTLDNDDTGTFITQSGVESSSVTALTHRS